MILNKSITLAITCYNERNTIKRAIESATNSKHITEILISDDFSTDGSLEIIKDLAKNDSRIKVIMNSGKPYSIRYNRLSQIYNIATEYVMFLDGDDYIENIDDVINKCFELGEWDMCYYPLKVKGKIAYMSVDYVDSKSNEELCHYRNPFICKSKMFKGIDDKIISNDYVSDDQIALYVLNHSILVGTLCDDKCYYVYNEGGKLRHLRKFGLNK